MASLPEDAGWVDGITMIEPGWSVKGGPVTLDNDGIPVDGFANVQAQELTARTKYLYDNMGQGGGGGGAPVQWIEANNDAILIENLIPGTMYILDSRNGNGLDIFINDTSAVPVGSEFHFVCAGEPDSVWIAPGGV